MRSILPVIVLIGFLMTGASALRGQDKPVAPEVQKQIDEAIKGLSSDTWKDRQQAAETLAKIGPAAVPALKELSEKATDNEVRTRAAAVIQQIDAAGRLGPSTITLKLKNVSPAEVFTQLGKQAKCEFATWPKTLWQNLGTREITIEAENVSFWEAFRQACEKTGVYPQQQGNDRRITLFQGGGNWFNGPSVTTGPFLVVANRIQRSNSVELSSPQNIQHDFQIGLTAYCEPKVKVVQASYNVKVEEAVDEKGNSLVADARMYGGMTTGNQWMWNLGAQLKYPENAGKKIAKFKGSLQFVVQVKSETLDVPDCMTVKNVEKTVANRRFLIKEVKKNGQQYEVLMTMYRDGMSQADWNAMSSPSQGLKLLDKDGRALSNHGWGGGGSNEKMDYQWHFGRMGMGDEGQPGEPFRLVWEIPTETREMNATFEFKDLPLP